MIMSRFLDDAYMAIFTSPLSCCSPTQEDDPIRGIEKSMRIEHDQPRLIPPPIAEPQERPTTRGQEWVDRTKSFASRASSRGSFTVKRHLNAYNGSRRPRIGNPTEFRHIETAVAPRGTKRGFRPLELSIYMPENQLSPILSHFPDTDRRSRQSTDLAFPARALTYRSESSMSFSIPRKPIRSSSRASSEWTAQFKPRPESLSANELLAALEHELPKAPPPARLRSMTEPPAYERVKSALHEKFELEQKLKDIDEIIEERKSIYFNSRPTSRASRMSRPLSIYSEANEPMPSVPVDVSVPTFTPVPIAPLTATFVGRTAAPLTDQRPRTAPAKTVHIPSRLTSFTQASAAFTTPSPSSTSSLTMSRQNYSDRDLPPPPPLPLILQAAPPALRKKKSFSSVSKWLFPTEHTRSISLDSVTNSPKPVTSREGFYQCVDFQPSPRHSTDSTVSTLQSTLDEPAMPNTWTPGSSPRSDVEKTGVTTMTFSIDSDRKDQSLDLSRTRTFGEREMISDENWETEPVPEQVRLPGRNSVGVAF